ncbi:MAG TPA: adenylate/guanylate cyclase domain-containing protein [Usitatibacter sp.]|nr:adenylate/guanylate cyclase domain-containing protein [Usitatibacter sp.]
MRIFDRGAVLPWLRAAVVCAGVIGFYGALGFTETWKRLELKGFDLLTVATAPGRSQLPITLVGIDEASMAEIGKQMPWPRDLHARLVDQLHRGGALVIALDLIIADRASDPAEDAALAQAIARSGNVVMAADMAYQESTYARQWMRVDPLPQLRQAGATAGLATVQLDGDTVVRRMPEGADVFWREIVRKVNAVRPGLLREPPPADGTMIRYVGPDHTFPFVSYYQALEADTLLPPDAFRDQIVIVGRDLKASPDANFTQRDMFATPFTETTRWFTPGVEIHANILESALRGDMIVPSGPWAPLGLLVASVGLAVAAMRRWRPFASLLVAAAMVALVAALGWALLAWRSAWLPVTASMAAIATTYVALGGLAFLTEQRRRAEVRRAFAFYVSPEVVEQVLRNPERLALGGEHREITALFTDLKGFTSLTEKLGAAEVTDLVNEHFTRATSIVKRHGGTVTAFIGDAIMAMWGAPVEQPRHPACAVNAAREMQEDIARMRAELAARGLPQIHMRIGVHTCMAVVGNLGAADRFHYTAMGDGVNLASRLEGVNKLYGTGILLSEETARRVDPGTPLRAVGRVIVKGKTEPVDIFTVEEDARVVAASAAAMQAYRARDWERSEALWRGILELRPGDGVSLHYLQMIASLRLEVPAAAWDGAEALDKM